ncbi:MAG: phosphatidate cytidylyltransferase [Chloroflexota bacterium]|jgi:phosphatidate cytidylyltransferase
MTMANATDATAASANQPNPVWQRVLTVAPLLPILVGSLWWNLVSVTVVVACASLLGLYELYRGLQQSGYTPYHRYGYAYGMIIVLACYVQVMYGIELLGAVLALGLIGSLIVAVFTANEDDRALPSWALSVAGVLYIPFLLSHLILLRSVNTPLTDGLLTPWVSPGFAWIVFALATTWLGDTFAYFVGRSMGRTPLAPHISPKKTWEGGVGGLVGAALTGIGCVYLFGLPISPVIGALLGGISGIIGPLGDLAESQIKRQIGVKDVGSLLPGHGGILDRIDSILFMVPIIYYGIVWLY